VGSSSRSGYKTASSNSASQDAASNAVIEDLHWSDLPEDGQRSLRQWCAGQLHGRHCMFIVEQCASADFVEPLNERKVLSGVSGLRGGAVLNALSGFHAEFGLAGGQEVSWLYNAVFSKSPRQVLEDAFRAAAEEVGEVDSTTLLPEQIHLALHRRALRVQHEACLRGGNDSRAIGKQSSAPRCLEMYVRVQVWLELLRLHAEGRVQSDHHPFSGGSAASEKELRDKGGGEKTAPGAAALDDANVVKELEKSEEDVEAESQRMSLDSLRSQNRQIEEYVMRLVRRRDDLKQMTKLAEEQDSYLLLGLDGPDVSEDAVKKAYRDLARREHPDKAGTGNKKRFQAIQHAYTSILRQRRQDSGLSSSTQEDEKGAAEKERVACKSVTAALLHASRGRDAANHVADCAHRALRGARESREANSQPKIRAFRLLRELTGRGGAELRDAAAQLRSLNEEICAVVQSAEQAMNEHEDWSTRAVAGIGLRDRAIMVEDAANSCVSSAELLEKISEAMESTVQKVAAADSAPKGPRGANGSLVQLGVQLLNESLGRTAGVARRVADEAISGALKALELSRALQTLDSEPIAKATGENSDDDAPMPAPDAENKSDVQANRATAGEDDPLKPEIDGRTSNASQEDKPEPTRHDGNSLKTAAERVKERHVSLRVKNLRFASSLNEEVIRAQGRLRTLLDRSDGAILPEITVAQKCLLFDLVAELLDSAFCEVMRQAGNFALPPGRCLARAVAFVLALEHGGEIGVPTDPRTQVMKLAALVDTDLLCQVINGPFSQQLLSAGTGRQRAAFAAVKSSGEARAKEGAMLAGRAWDEAVRACCARMISVISKVVISGSDDGLLIGADS
jgi:hypothetical protein